MAWYSMTFLFLKRRLKKPVNLTIFAGYIKIKTKIESILFDYNLLEHRMCSYKP